MGNIPPKEAIWLAAFRRDEGTVPEVISAGNNQCTNVVYSAFRPSKGMRESVKKENFFHLKNSLTAYR